MMQYLRILVMLFLFCGWVEATPPTQNLSAKEILSQMPQEDLKALDQLFRILFLENYFAYTLFSTKSMTHKGAFFDILEDQSNKNESDYVFLDTWKIWKKYASRPEFQIFNYAFVEKKFSELFSIHFLNKKNVIVCVQTHLATFKEVLGEDVNPEKVYQDMIAADDVFEALGNSQILYGILFGFGEKNARGYHEKFILELDIPEPTSFNEEDSKPNQLPLPFFAVFGRNRETDVLRRKYQRERKKILSLYAKGNFLEITLTQLLSNN